MKPFNQPNLCQALSEPVQRKLHFSNSIAEHIGHQVWCGVHTDSQFYIYILNDLRRRRL